MPFNDFFGEETVCNIGLGLLMDLVWCGGLYLYGIDALLMGSRGVVVGGGYEAVCRIVGKGACPALVVGGGLKLAGGCALLALAIYHGDNNDYAKALKIAHVLAFVSFLFVVCSPRIKHSIYIFSCQ